MFENKGRMAHVMRTSKGFHVCIHCGGDVDSDGLAMAAPGDEPESAPRDEGPAETKEDKDKGLRIFALALKKGSNRSTEEGERHVAGRTESLEVVR